ncbi:MAG: Response regulator PleD [Phycisphaerae bacterium]|nr:Response regulator PleD [Phycisphaerae bacterium]
MMKVLVVDDSPAAIQIARVRLESEGVEVISASGGRAGLTLARSQSPDLILLDVDMPDMSGFDVCRELKEDASLNLVPVIFLSGSSDADDRVTGLDLGAVDFISKPFDAFELRARVRAALRTKRLQDMLLERAKIDPLTGLANRRAVIERLEQEWARIQRQGGTLSFVMADVDNFKCVNDRHGHGAGDRLLMEIARVLLAQCRKCDLPARYGGEEFSLVVPGEATPGAVAMAERCRGGIQEIRLQVGAGTLRVTASFGVADSSSCDSAAALIEQADEALYQAKHDGRNRVVAPVMGEVQ